MTIPRLKTSLRGSTWPPAICSGLMYGPNPITLPTAVRGSALQSSCRVGSSSRVLFAMPKSSTFTCPRCVSIRLAGLMSRIHGAAGEKSNREPIGLADRLGIDFDEPQFQPIVLEDADRNPHTFKFRSMLVPTGHE